MNTLKGYKGVRKLDRPTMARGEALLMLSRPALLFVHSQVDAQDIATTPERWHAVGQPGRVTLYRRETPAAAPPAGPTPRRTETDAGARPGPEA